MNFEPFRRLIEAELGRSLSSPEEAQMKTFVESLVDTFRFRGTFVIPKTMEELDSALPDLRAELQRRVTLCVDFRNSIDFCKWVEVVLRDLPKEATEIREEFKAARTRVGKEHFGIE